MDNDSSMDKLLSQLRHEMTELRDQSNSLAKQMWLLYVTFEDFVFLKHSNKKNRLFKTTINIDNYLKSPSSTQKSNVYKKLTDKEVSVSNLKLFTKDDQQDTIVKSELIVCSVDKSSTCSQTICADLPDNEKTKTCCREFTVGYQIAHIQSLGRLHRNNIERVDKKLSSNVINQCHSMEIDRAYRRNRKTDKMHYLNGHNLKNNKRCNKSSNCADIVRVDKQANSKDNVSAFTNQSKDLLSQEGGLKHQQIRIQTGDNYRCKSYNPVLNITNNCLNRPDDRLSASAIVNVNGCILDPRVRTLPDTVSKGKLTNKTPLSLPVRQCWKDNRSLENLSDISKNSNDLKRTVLSPLEHAKPEPIRSPKRHCIYMSSKLNYDLLLGENVNQGDRSLSDSFEHVLNDTQESKSQFDDVLLKDVEGEMSVTNPCDSSPVTISSGYESDSVQTCEAEIDHIFMRNKNKVVKKDTEPGTPTDYFSMSDSLPNTDTKMVAEEKVPKINVSCIPERPLTKETAKQNIKNALSAKLQTEKVSNSNNDSTPARFSPVQRQNYQLTKVARSMFEIIHDLQSEDESSDPNKKKFRKVRRSQSKDIDPEVQKLSNVSSKTVAIDSRNTKGDEQTTESQTCENSKSEDQSRMSIKCLRKPLGSEPSRFAMGRKNPKSIFINNNSEHKKQKDGSNPGPLVGDTRMFKQIGELPFDSQNDNTNSFVSANKVTHNASRDHRLRVSVRDFNSQLPMHEHDQQTSATNTVWDKKVRTSNQQPPPQNFSHVNSQGNIRQSTSWNDFTRSDIQEGTRTNNFDTFKRSSRDQLGPQVQPSQQFSGKSETHNRAVLLRGPKSQSGFQDLSFMDNRQETANNLPLQERWNGVNGNVPLWSCNGRMQIVENGCSPYATARIPGCQTPRRDERDDHVYETIPGDEYLYEELMRLRRKGILFPRFCKMAEMPGAFIPFEPPALPARNGPRDVSNANKNCVLQRDINSNFQPTRASFNVPSHTDLIPSDLKLRMRSASWDGYSKIDNDSVMGDKSIHQNWNALNFMNHMDGIRQPPPKRRENFYLLLSNKQSRADFSHSLELETKLKGMGIVLNDKCVNRLNVDNYETVDNVDVTDPQDEVGPQFLQSTYV